MLKNNELMRIAERADWYLKKQTDFDKKLISFRWRSIEPYCKGPDVLELGPAEGCITRFLIEKIDKLTVVDGSDKLLRQIPDAPNIIKIHSLFEEFKPEKKFDTIIMDHILEHIEEPISLLTKAKTWMADGGRLLAGVPNANSIHRLVAVKMGILKNPGELNKRDNMLGHRRVYTSESFKKELLAAGLSITEMGGVFLKPLSNHQIENQWTDEMIHGFYEMGKEFPEISAEIYAVCEKV